MADKRRAAIAADKIGDTTLDKLTASEFVDALQHHRAIDHVRFWPEKKKYELELEPGAIGKLRFRDFVDIVERIKGEKKKVELEIPDHWRWVVNPAANPDPTPWNPGIGNKLDELVTKLDELTERINAIERG